MKLASFATAGRASYGLITDGGLIDLGARLSSRYPTLRAALADDALGEIARTAAAKPDLALADATLLPPITAPDKIVCIGLNYRAHAAEAGLQVPEHPSLFLRLTNTLVPHGGALVRPSLSSAMDYEGELAVVIGRSGRHIATATALDHVAGYACFNDGSLRDYQRQHSVIAGKNFLATGGFGPWLVTSDEIPDPSQLTLTTRLNGVEVQRGETADMIFSVPQIISYVSTFTRLEPGDVISTGTPPGVGMARQPPCGSSPVTSSRWRFPASACCATRSWRKRSDLAAVHSGHPRVTPFPSV
jgi:2-keto-4-pentenoate hydratase/2-oxohepta-3-ene-1,7-dioic acid hydratase in catechol pathway